jgi:hypothetical protein
MIAKKKSKQHHYKEHHSMTPYIITLIAFAVIFSLLTLILLTITEFVNNTAALIILSVILIIALGSGLLFRIILDHLHLSLTQEEIGTAIVSGLAGIFSGILTIYLKTQVQGKELLTQKNTFILTVTNEYILSSLLISLFYLAPIIISYKKKENWKKFCIYYICTIPIGLLIICISSFFIH